MSLSPKTVFDPEIQAMSVDARLTAGFERISEAFRVMLWEQAKSANISPIQIQVLIFARYHPREMATVTAIAQEFNLSKATVSDTIKTLLQKKLLKKNQDPRDTRSFFLTLTKSGQNLVSRTEGFTDIFTEILANYSGKEKKNALRLLGDIIYHLNRTGILQVQRMCTNCGHYTLHKSKGYCSHLEIPVKSKDLRLDCPHFSVRE